MACQATVTSPQGKIVYKESDWGVCFDSRSSMASRRSGRVCRSWPRPIQNGDAVGAFEFVCLCPARPMTSLQGSGYPGKWLQEPTRLVVLSQEMNFGQHATQCELNTSVHTDRAYIRNTTGVIVAITPEQYKKMFNIQAKASPNEQNTQRTSIEISNSSNPPPTPAPQMQPERSGGATLNGGIPTPVKQDGNATADLLISQVPPVYPPLARQARIQGKVLLHVIIGTEGNVEQIEVISGHPLLIQSAVDAVKQWRYKKLLLYGTPVKVNTTVTVTFTMGDSPAPATQAP